MYEFTSEKNRSGQVTIGALYPFYNLVAKNKGEENKEL